MDYDAFKALIISTAGLTGDTDFDAAFNGLLDLAELRALRKLDVLATRAYRTVPIVTGTPLVAPPPDMVVLRSFDYFTPAGTTDTRVPLIKVKEDFLRDYWPTAAAQGLPKFWALQGEHSIRIAPAPNAVYTAEMAITRRLQSLAVGPGTQTTVLSTKYQDVLFASMMISTHAHMKNYGAQSDDPRGAVSWKAEFNELVADALQEEGRNKSLAYADESASQPPESAPVQ